MSGRAEGASIGDVREARRLFPATDQLGLLQHGGGGSGEPDAVVAAYHRYIDEWAATRSRLRPRRGCGRARTDRGGRPDRRRPVRRRVDRVGVGRRRSGRGPVRPGQPGAERRDRRARVQLEPLPVATAGEQGLRGSPGPVPKRRAGARRHRAHASTAERCWSRSAACRPRPDTAPTSRRSARSRERSGAIVFVDGSQLVGALPVADDLAAIDVLATADHKFLMHAGRGLGYCYLSREVQDRFVPINAGWKAGRVPFESFFGPTMDLSPTASRFDNSISWLAAVGNEAALSVFDEFGADAIYARNRELAELLRASLAEVGWTPVDLPEANRSTIVSVPLGDAEPAPLLAELKRARRRLLGPRRQPAPGGPLLQPRGRHRAGRDRARPALIRARRWCGTVAGPTAGERGTAGTGPGAGLAASRRRGR